MLMRNTTYCLLSVFFYGFIANSLLGQDKPDPLHKLMLEQSYTAVPLTPGESPNYTVEAQIGTEKIRLLLDTGAAHSVIYSKVLDKTPFAKVEERQFNSMTGSSTLDVVVVRKLTIGDYDSRNLSSKIDVLRYDSAKLPKSANGDEYHGVLGHAFLTIADAVIDYKSHTLYLRKPLDKLWPEIEGKWTTSSGQSDGLQLDDNSASAYRVEFDDKKMILTTPEKRYTFGIHAKLEGSTWILAMFDPDKELDDEFNYSGLAMMRIKDGSPVICVGPYLANIKADPANFAAPKDSGLILLELEKQK